MPILGAYFAQDGFIGMYPSLEWSLFFVALKIDLTRSLRL